MNDSILEYEKERILVSYYVGNHKLMSMVSPIIEGSYFDPRLSKVVKWAKEYFHQYKEPPTFQQIEAETGIKLLSELKDTTSSGEIDWAANELENLCRNKAIEEALFKSVQLLDEKKHSEIITNLKNAVSTGLTRDLGIDVFENPSETLKMSFTENPLISTGWPDVDYRIGGGIGRGELILFLANSGGGKSVNKLNLALNLLLQGYSGVYASLEMGAPVVTKRLFSMMSGYSISDMFKNVDAVANTIINEKLKCGKFFVMRFPENRTNIGHIKAWIDTLGEKTGFKPDFIVIDYVDITGSLTKTSGDNMFIKDKYVTEEVRSLGFDYDAVMISSSQFGRSAIDEERVHQGHIQGGMSKINTSDVCIGIQQTDIMKAAGELKYTYLKVRNGDGTNMTTMMNWNPISLRVTCKESSQQVKQLVTAKKNSIESLLKPRKEVK